MIQLGLPVAGQDRYMFAFNACFGPYDQLYRDPSQMIWFDSDLQTIEEEKGIYHENNVTHDKVSGAFYYHPFAHGILPQPSPQYPYGLTFPIWNPSNPKDANARNLAKCGLAVDGHSCYYYTGSDLKQIVQRCYDHDSVTGLWTITEAMAFVSSPYTCTQYSEFTIKSFKDLSGAMKYCYYDLVSWTNVSNYSVSLYDMSHFMSYEEIKSLKINRPIRGKSSSYIFSYFYQARSDPASLSTADAKGLVDVLTAELGREFPIPDKHFGDLAMDASKKAQANSVNMIAFFKDLRHPTEMIPKLRNLSSLKGLADNVLTVDYGILPTVSDLKTIWQAFQKIRPFIDSNGFSVYNADHRESKRVDLVNYSLEQHIKLAIDDEDSEILRLATAIDSWGFAPTLENLWDLVPYSFVVDWFVDVGGLLERIDTGLRLAMKNIRYVTMSRKTTVSGKFPANNLAPIVGKLEWVHYHRWVSDQCPVPPLSLSTTFQDFDHWLESGALIAQRAKH